MADDRETKRQLQEENAGLKSELTELEESFANLDFHTQEVRAERKALKSEVQRLQQERDSMKIERDIARIEVEKLSQQARQGTDGLDRETERLVQQLVQQLEIQVQHLQRDLALKDPLFRIGVAVRARFLENAKFYALSVEEKRSKINKYQARVKNAGDFAAHRALGMTDKYLFENGVLTSQEHASLRLVFTKLYNSTPEEYVLMAPKMQEAMDCDATIKTLFVLNSSLRPLKERETALIDIDTIKTKYGKLSKEEFEADEDITRRLARVKVLTNNILEADRKRHDGNGGGKGGSGGK